MKRIWAVLPALVLLAFQSDDRKTSTGLLADGQKLEAEMRSSTVTLGQLAAAIAKIDAEVEKLEAKRKQYDAEASTSDPAKERMKPLLDDLTAKRAPLDVDKTRLDAERTRINNQKFSDRALATYKKGVEKAAGEGRKDVLAKSLLGIARINETLGNIAEAQASYTRVTADCGDEKVEAEVAKDKLLKKGVDVYVAQFGQYVADWRDLIANSPALLEEKKKEISGKVLPLDKEAIYGLTASLANRDEVVRGFAAEMLAEVVDGDGISAVITKLNDSSVDLRAGAGLAINRVFNKWSQAAAYDREAEKIREDLASLSPDDAKAKALIEKNKGRAKDLETKAESIRHHIPKDMGRPAIEQALQKLLADESAVAPARIEAAKAVEAIGEVAGGLIDAIGQGLNSKNRSVREACCVAASGVDTTNVEAKHKLVDRLMQIVRYQPETDTKAMGERDLANDNAVRAAAANSLGRIGSVKSIPALIEALSDNHSDVRTQANQALKDITGKDLGFESNPLVTDPSLADPKAAHLGASELAVQQETARKAGIEKWTAWWNDTQGVSVLVNRFWKFQASWKAGDPSRLFDKDAYLRDLKSRLYIFTDEKAQYERAERSATRFQAKKEFLQRDAADLGPTGLEKMFQFISGQCDSDKGLTVDLQLKSRAVVRLFVAETTAKMIEKAGADKVSMLRDKLSSGTKDEKAGAALGIGFLPAAMVGGSEREALEKSGLGDGDADVKAAAANALARVGTAENGPALARVATTNATDRAGEAAQIAALRALVALAPKSADIVKQLGEMVAGASYSNSASVREYGCDALAAIAHPSAVQNRWLLKARRDFARPVREAAAKAIKATSKGSAETATFAADVLKNNDFSAQERAGAAMALGDMGEGKYAANLIDRIIDINTPTVKNRDNDPAVRAACCEALGAMGEAAKYKQVAETLIKALEDTSDEVQRQANEALKKISGAATLPKFEIEMRAADKADAINNMKVWYDQNKGSWKDLG